jgi:hypothetical protein
MSLARRRCEMAIAGGLRDRLEAGTRLVARYKGADYVAEVVAGAEGKPRYRLADGQEFKSPSAAGSAVMGGIACNGWHFWSLEGEATAAATKPTTRAVQPNTAPTPTVAGTGQDADTAKARPRCTRCGKQFVGAKQLAHHEANADRLCVVAV